MKIILLIIVSMFGFNSFSIGQKQTEKEIKALLCCKWKVSSFQPLGGEIKKASGYNIFMTFSSDGSLLKVDPRDTISGKWSYEHRSKLIYLKEKNRTLEHKIITITADELVIDAILDGKEGYMTLKKVEEE